jgi:hypothetical protein
MLAAPQTHARVAEVLHSDEPKLRLRNSFEHDGPCLKYKAWSQAPPPSATRSTRPARCVGSIALRLLRESYVLV